MKNGLYKHFKGNTYRVTGVAIHSETSEEFVIYHNIQLPEKVFIRPKAMFDETIERDGKWVKRFLYMSDGMN